MRLACAAAGVANAEPIPERDWALLDMTDPVRMERERQFQQGKKNGGLYRGKICRRVQSMMLLRSNAPRFQLNCRVRLSEREPRRERDLPLRAREHPVLAIGTGVVGLVEQILHVEREAELLVE